MKVTQNVVAAPVVQVCRNGGAMIGDKILFSSHNPKNSKMPSYLTHNKLYTVKRMSEDNQAIWDDDFATPTNNSESGWRTGQYDIIERAPQAEPVKPEFQPVSLLLETQGEVDFITSLLGGTNTSLERSFGITEDTYPEWHKLDKIASEDRPLIDYVKLSQ